jgi:hypothetical protein
MKSKFLVIPAIIALAGFGVVFNCGAGWAQQQQVPPVPFDETKCMIPVEFSTDTLSCIMFGDVDFMGVPDPQQNLYTEPPDFLGPPHPGNTFDFGTSGEVDALANGGDALFHELKHNQATLLVSLQHDPLFGGQRIAVWYELPAGPSKGPKWTHTHLDANLITLNNTLELDALEVWGPLDSDDANFYSLIGDPVAVAVKRSVFYWNGAVSTPYIDHAVIVTAVQALGYIGPPDSVDLDALMLFENEGINGNKVWDAGDTIIFSIKDTRPLGGNWDGGEIVVLGFGGTPFFLYHDSHLWDTAFKVAEAFGVDRPPILDFPVVNTIPPPGSLPRIDTVHYFEIIHQVGQCAQICSCCTVVIEWLTPSSGTDTVHLTKALKVNLERVTDSNNDGLWSVCDYQRLHFKTAPDSCKCFWYHVEQVGHVVYPPELYSRMVLYKVPLLEEVDAIEAYPYDFPMTPTLTEWGLVILVVLLIASTVFVLLKRRKAATPA